MADHKTSLCTEGKLILNKKQNTNSVDYKSPPAGGQFYFKSFQQFSPGSHFNSSENRTIFDQIKHTKSVKIKKNHLQILRVVAGAAANHSSRWAGAGLQLGQLAS